MVHQKYLGVASITFMSESDPGEERFNKVHRFTGTRGRDYGLWRLRLRAACCLKEVWDVVGQSLDGNSESASSTGPDPRRMSKREKASGIIISANGDAALRVALEADDDPTRMITLLDRRYTSNRTVSGIAVSTQLFRMQYTGRNMSMYIYQYTSPFAQLEMIGSDSAIPEAYKAPMLLTFIDPKCSLAPIAEALSTKDVSKLSWDCVTTILMTNIMQEAHSGLGHLQIEGPGEGLKIREDLATNGNKRDETMMVLKTPKAMWI